MFLCVFSFFLFFSSQEKLQNDNLFYLFLTFFFWTLHFFQHRLCRKNFMFCVFRSLLIFSFSFICFHVVFCLIFLDLLRNMLPFQSVFFTSLFPLFVHPLSICSFFFSSCFLVSFTFSHFLNFLFVDLFIISMFLYVKLIVEKIFLHFCETIFSSFHIKKTSFSLFPFLLGFFYMFFHVWSFSVSWKIVSRFYNPPFFFILLFNSVSLFSPFLMYPKTRMFFCREMWEKLSFVFCFCSLGLKTFRVQKIRFIFPLFLKFLLKSFSLFMKNHRRNSAIKPSFFCFCSVPFLFHFLSFNIFFHHFFLGSLFYISFWFSLLFLFSLFFILSLFFHLRVSPFFFLYLMFPCLFFFIAAFVNLLFVLPHFSSLSFVLDLIFLFILLLYLFLKNNLRIYFWPKKFKKFGGQFFYMKSCLCFLNPPFFGVFISCFFPPWVVLIPCFVPCFTDY